VATAAYQGAEISGRHGGGALGSRLGRSGRRVGRHADRFPKWSVGTTPLTTTILDRRFTDSAGDRNGCRSQHRKGTYSPKRAPSRRRGAGLVRPARANLVGQARTLSDMSIGRAVRTTRTRRSARWRGRALSGGPGDVVRRNGNPSPHDHHGGGRAVPSVGLRPGYSVQITPPF